VKAFKVNHQELEMQPYEEQILVIPGQPERGKAERKALLVPFLQLQAIYFCKSGIFSKRKKGFTSRAKVWDDS